MQSAVRAAMWQIKKFKKRGMPKDKVSAPSSFIANAALYTGKGHLLKNTQGNR